MATIKLKAAELVLGDQVDLLGSPFGWATVVQITGEEVHMVRPYIHIADFTYTGGVMNYIGTETVKVFKGEGCSRTYNVDASTHARMSKAGALR